MRGLCRVQHVDLHPVAHDDVAALLTGFAATSSPRIGDRAAHAMGRTQRCATGTLANCTWVELHRDVHPRIDRGIADRVICNCYQISVVRPRGLQ